MIPAGAIDCDIHPAVPNTRALLPHLEPYWREHVLRRGHGAATTSRPAPSRRRADQRAGRTGSPQRGLPGSSLAALQAHVLDPLQPRAAICNVLHGAQMMMSEDLSAALCRAINNWLAAEWLDRDPRLRASIVVPVHSPDLAAEEIERWRRDPRFVQVLLLAMTEMPLGRRQIWPIYRAAEKHGLPIGIHAGSQLPPSAERAAAGRPSTSRTMSPTRQGFAAALNQPAGRRRVPEIPRPAGWC